MTHSQVKNKIKETQFLNKKVSKMTEWYALLHTLLLMYLNGIVAYSANLHIDLCL